MKAQHLIWKAAAGGTLALGLAAGSYGIASAATSSATPSATVAKVVTLSSSSSTTKTTKPSTTKPSTAMPAHGNCPAHSSTSGSGTTG